MVSVRLRKNIVGPAWCMRPDTKYLENRHTRNGFKMVRQKLRFLTEIPGVTGEYVQFHVHASPNGPSLYTIAIRVYNPRTSEEKLPVHRCTCRALPWWLRWGILTPLQRPGIGCVHPQQRSGFTVPQVVARFRAGQIDTSWQSSDYRRTPLGSVGPD